MRVIRVIEVPLKQPKGRVNWARLRYVFRVIECAENSTDPHEEGARVLWQSRDFDGRCRGPRSLHRHCRDAALLSARYFERCQAAGLDYDVPAGTLDDRCQELGLDSAGPWVTQRRR